MKNIFKKSIALMAVLALTVCCFAGCGSQGSPQVPGDDSQEEEALQIVTTIFPEYDWVRNVLGDNPQGAQVNLLIKNGVDPHSFQPSADDILKISTADVFVYVGGESDKWVGDALANATNENMVVVNLLEVLGDAAKEEELAEGMQGEAEDGEDAEEEPEYDEHVWLSLRNAETLVTAISDALSSADPENAESYKTNAEAYIAKIQALDNEYQTAVSEAPVKTVLFGDRFPFRYLTDDYGIEYFAAFAGCSAETEASFETVTFLSKKVDELGLRSVLTIEGSDQKLAETIVQNTESKDQQILVLNSMQSVSGDDAIAGATYLGIMESNLEVLKEAMK